MGPLRLVEVEVEVEVVVVVEAWDLITRQSITCATIIRNHLHIQ